MRRISILNFVSTPLSTLTIAMPTKENLIAVIKKYRVSPSFDEIDVINPNPNQPGAWGDTLLHLTAGMGSLDDLCILIGADGNVNALGDMGNTPLHSASMAGQDEAVKLLLNHGADPNIKNELGETPLQTAIQGHHKLIVGILMRATRES